MKFSFPVLLVFTLISFNGNAQFAFDQTHIPVIKDGEFLLNPWAGGLNAVQYNSVDLNEDGVEDLVLFDRTSNKLTTFLADGGQYVYTPEYEYLFPDDLVSWVTLVDYNCDGLKDLFTDADRGFRAFRNLGNLNWELDEDPVRTQGSTSRITLLFNATDISVFKDQDGDGDVDILVFNFATGETIRLHRNLSIENTGQCGLDFDFENNEYGGIHECACGEFLFNEPCLPAGRQLHTGGKAMLSLDYDLDGDEDLLLGEETCDELFLLENRAPLGSDAVFDDFRIFPQPITMRFPAAYQIDLDFDGTEDLMVSYNGRSNEEELVDLSNSNLLFKNVSSTRSEYELIQSDFLQRGMIEVGEKAVPETLDIDGDGDLDLFVSNQGSFIDGVFSSSITLYLNTGTSSNPSFELVTSDYLNLSALNYRSIIPQFIPVDDNSVPDLLLTVFKPEELAYTTYLIPGNEENGGLSFDLEDRISWFESELLSDFPHFFDVDSDGNIDLLLGHNTGRLEYYVNEESNANPNFVLEESEFLQISTSILKRNLVARTFTAGGQLNLVTTDATGEMTIYTDFPNNDEGSTDLFRLGDVQSMVTSRFGIESYPLISDFYGSGSIDLLVGTVAGGLYLYRDQSESDISNIELQINVYPNPILIGGPFSMESNIDGEVQLFDLAGRLLAEDIEITAGEPLSIVVPNSNPGLLLIRVSDIRGRSKTARLIVSE